MPSTGTPASIRSATSASSPASRTLLIARGNAPTPGRIIPAASPRGVRVAGDEALGADALEGLLHRPQVSHPVVENGDSRQVSVPFVLGTPGSSGSIDTASRSARANALKHASTMWCALVP